MGDSDVKSGDSPHYDNFYSPSNNFFYRSNQYPDLDTTKDEIRLITLLAGNSDEPLECYLINNLALSGVKWTYKAVSYPAGDPKNTTTILINETPFNVFANLGDALRRIRTQEGGLQRSIVYVRCGLIRSACIQIDTEPNAAET